MWNLAIVIHIWIYIPLSPTCTYLFWTILISNYSHQQHLLSACCWIPEICMCDTSNPSIPPKLVKRVNTCKLYFVCLGNDIYFYKNNNYDFFEDCRATISKTVFWQPWDVKFVLDSLLTMPEMWKKPWKLLWWWNLSEKWPCC